MNYPSPTAESPCSCEAAPPRSLTIYLAGPMRGHELFNFPEFDRAAAQLRGQGHTVVSPAEMARAAGFDPHTATLEDYQADRAIQMKIAVMILSGEIDAIALLPGWEKSIGAQAERALGLWAGISPRLISALTDLAPPAKTA